MSRRNEYNPEFGVVFEDSPAVAQYKKDHPELFGGSAAGGGAAATATQPSYPPVPAGYTVGRDPSTAYIASYQHGSGRNVTSTPGKIYIKDGNWSAVLPITADEYKLGIQGAPTAGTTTAGASGGTSPTPPTGGQPAPSTTNVNGQNVAAAPAQQLYTPERNLNQVILSNGRYANPDFQFGSRAFTATGAQPGYFAPGQMLSYQIGGGLPGQGAPLGPTAAAADTRTASSFQPNGPAVPQAGAPPPGFMPSGTPTGPLGGAMPPAPAPAGQVTGQVAQSFGQGATAGGVNLSPQVVAAVQQTWPAELVPQALALVARESSGNPNVDNSKGYQGGPLNNDPRFGNAPGSLGYNSVDYGLFGINDKAHFDRLGLTPESARDPVTNAAAAYQIFKDAGGWSPWTGNGTIPLPAPAQVTGQAAQGFEPTPTTPALPPQPPIPMPPLQGQAQGQGGGGGGGGSFGGPLTNPLNPLEPVQVPGAPQGINPLAPLAPQAGAQVITNPLNPLEPIRLPGQFDPNAYRDTRSFLDMARQEGGGPRPGLLEQARAGATAPGLGYFDQLRAQQSQVPGAPAAGQAPIVLDSGFTQPPPPTPQSFLQMARNAPTTIPPAIGSTATPRPFYEQNQQKPPNDQLAPWAQTLLNGIGNLYSGQAAGAGGGAAAGPAAATQPAVDPLTVNLRFDGPQTTRYDLPGGAGGGYNPYTILQGFQRNGTGDPRVDSMMAKQLMDAQNSLITAGLSPLAARDALLAPQRQDALPIGGTTWVQNGANPEQMQRTDAGYYFSPGGQTITPGGSPTTSGYQEMPFGSGGAYGDQPRFFAGGGSFLRGNQNGPVDSFALQRAIQDLQRNQTGYVPREDMRGYQPRPFASGGSFMTTAPTLFPMAGGGQAVTSEYGQPEMVTEHGRRVDVTPMATGGSFTTPKPGTTTYDEPPPPSTGTDLTNTGTPNLDYPAPPAYSNPPGGETPTNQGNTQDPNPPPPPPPGALPPLSGYGGAMDTNPELANQLELARQQQARDTYGYQYRAAGVPLPTGISSMTRPDNLAPGQYWQPIDYTNQIQQLEARLAALGPQQGWTPLDPAQIAMIRGGGGGEGPGLQGYRNPDPATADLMEMQNKQQLDRYMQAQDLMSQIGNLRASQPTPFQLPGGQPTSPFVGPQAFQDVVDRTPTQPGATLAALGQDAQMGQWSPQSSDKLVQLATSGADPNGLQALVQQLNAGRAIPPELNPQAYKNPVAAAAAMKFT